MKPYRTAAFMMIFIALLMIGLGVLGALGRMAKAGRISPKLVSMGIIGIVLFMFIVTAAVILRAAHNAKVNRSGARSSDILADIIRLGEEEKRRQLTLEGRPELIQTEKGTDTDNDGA